MKEFNIIQIINLSDVELIVIIENHNDYSIPSIIYSYAEITRRNLVINEIMQKNVNEFANKYLKNDDADINKTISRWCKKEEAESYNELYLFLTGKKERPINLEILSDSIIEVDINCIYSAGRAIKFIVYSMLILIFFMLVGFMIVTNVKDSTAYIYFFGILCLVCAIIILFKLYEAGDNLEKSVE